MRRLRDAIFGLIGLLLVLIGVPGVKDVVASWVEWLSFVRSVMENPFGYGAIVLLGVLFLVLAATDVLVDHKLAHAGGSTGREFTANWNEWAVVDDFTVWQAAWLWANLEPQSASTPMEGTRAYPIFRRMKKDFDSGKVKGAAQINGSWQDTSLPRQMWMDYAAVSRDWPRFLFRRRRLSLWRSINEVASGYWTISYWEHGALEKAKNNGSPNATIEEVRVEILKWLQAGNLRATAREEIDGVLYPRRNIPRRMWLRARRDYSDGIAVGMRNYRSVTVEMVRNANLNK